MTLTKWEALFQEKLETTSLGDDPAHDLAHFKRVVSTSRRLAREESAKLDVVIPAAWLHDLVNLPKSHPDRHKASTLSAESALQCLKELNYPPEYHSEIYHAVQAHSFSAKIEAVSLEAKVVQDADRLDALGAIGIARCFSVGGALKRPLYSLIDPFGETRELDDRSFTLDHFYVKLLRLADSFQTQSGKVEAHRRTEFLFQFISQLKTEI